MDRPIARFREYFTSACWRLISWRTADDTSALPSRPTSMVTDRSTRPTSRCFAPSPPICASLSPRYAKQGRSRPMGSAQAAASSAAPRLPTALPSRTSDVKTSRCAARHRASARVPASPKPLAATSRWRSAQSWCRPATSPSPAPPRARLLRASRPAESARASAATPASPSCAPASFSVATRSSSAPTTASARSVASSARKRQKLRSSTRRCRSVGATSTHAASRRFRSRATPFPVKRFAPSASVRCRAAQVGRRSSASRPPRASGASSSSSSSAPSAKAARLLDRRWSELRRDTSVRRAVPMVVSFSMRLGAWRAPSPKASTSAIASAT
mmetsp:Transcript_16571/g.57137  ORF Transcript_16571/g.57137 Transcript_16571/m.57137 type:complete len:330 (-) Transcript_16571:2920-3909(-)